MKNTIEKFVNSKGKEKLTMLTSYDYLTTTIIDEVGINGILVGDSLGMIFQGNDNTLSVTVDEIIYHTKAVVKGSKNSLVISDMPFMSYQTSINDAIVNAGNIIKKGGSSAVKIEGGVEIAEHIQKITKSSIPVMGHIGLTPQSVNVFGGFKVQGTTKESAIKIIEDAKSIEQAGAFAIVLECIPERLSKIITDIVKIPTIGIGAGKYCDGQILVYQDMLGINNNLVKFVKNYGNLSNIIKEAFCNYIEDVKKEQFPEKKHSFKINDDIINEIKNLF
ncbi:MAG: 3-methyl-2-oxobutanoate hydroxymethyltransferase [Defluviitaleaceae bacterium]|nr:3-methyl-2-oxobutanoate hydroxymethyltransferase [Defluviitaleaceae bacterium]